MLKILGLCFFLMIFSQSANSSTGNANALEFHISYKSLLRKSSPDLFMRFRSNAPHYWAWAKTKALDLRVYASALTSDGVIAGDPHILNFGDIDLQPAKVTLIDLDDAGRGPLFFDLLRLYTSQRASPFENKDHMETKDFLKAYLQGLENKNYDIPKFIDDFLSASRQKQAREKGEFLKAATLNLKLFNKKSLQLSEIRTGNSKVQIFGQFALQEIHRRFSNQEILDTGYKISMTGGSKGMIRFWFLMRNRLGNISIIEVKQMSIPAVSQFAKQLNSKNRIEEVRRFFWDNNSDHRYQVLNINGIEFWMRPRYGKQISIDVPESAKSSESNLANNLLLYYAYLMGRAHGAQASANREVADYIQFLTENKSEVRDLLKDLSKEYLSELK